MIYNITPTKASSIYSQYDNMNTGRDQVLSLQTKYKDSTSNYISRILIQYDLYPYLVKLNLSTSSIQKVNLKIYGTSEQYLSYNTNIRCYALYKP